MFDDIKPKLKTLTNRQSSSTFCYSLYPPSNYSSFQRMKPNDTSTYSSYHGLYPSRFDSPVRKHQPPSQFLHKRQMKNSSRAYSESNLLSFAQRKQRVDDLLEKKQREKKILENLQSSLNATLSTGCPPTSSISIRSDLYGSLIRPKTFNLSKDRLDKRFAMSANSSTPDFSKYKLRHSKDRLDKRLVVATDCGSPDFSSMNRRLSKDRLDKRLVATADCSTPEFMLKRRQSKDRLDTRYGFTNECRTPELSLKRRTHMFENTNRSRLYEGSNDALYSLYGDLPVNEYQGNSSVPGQNRTFPRRSKKARRSIMYDGDGALSVIEDACSKSSTSDGSCSMSMSNVTDIYVKPFTKNKLSAMKTLSFTISKNEVIDCIESSL